MIQEITVLGSFAFLGAGLKYIDQVYDEGIFHRPLAFLLTLFCGVLMGLMISFDPPSAILLLGITLGVAITGKLDNFSFHVVALIAVIFPVLVAWSRLVPGYQPNIHWAATFIVMFSGAFDEYLDELGDRTKKKILTLRPAMKLTVLGMYFSGVFGFLYFLAMIAFDLSYISVDIYSRHWAADMAHLGNQYISRRSSRISL